MQAATRDGCELTFIPFAAGEQRLGISYRGVSVRGSPFRVPVSAGPAHAPNCYTSGEGCKAAIPGKLAHFTLHCRDRWNNPCTEGATRVSVR